ncbi:Amino acid/metabolite permease [Minicystis rosea]|nr:Amino acid/metabolite permease [Minicystis rosea]
MTHDHDSEGQAVSDDVKALERLGYAQELRRGMSAFSNYAISLSIICILAGGVTSFQVGYCSVGGASIGLGWPLSCLFSLAVAVTMGQVASAFPTAGGLYHWASILGGRGFGWVTAWFNLAGLVTVLAAINVGTWQFAAGALGPRLGFDPAAWSPGRALAVQTVAVVLITASQALVNHRGIRATTRLTDFSGYWILGVSLAITVALIAFAPALHGRQLITFTNYSGPRGGDVWPAQGHLPWLFVLGFLLPAYTITGFDASAHTAEETIGAQMNVPKGIVRSVLVSGIFGWIMLSAAVIAAPHPDAAAAQGTNAFAFILGEVLPSWLATALQAGIALAQYLCGLATVTSASRMTFAFARDGGLPASNALRKVSPRHRTPAIAIWATAGLSVAFTVYTPVYSTIAAVCVIFLYVSYVIPTALGLYAWGRTWTVMGPWSVGWWYRPLSLIAVLFGGLLIVVGIQPPNDKALWILGGMTVVLCVGWIGIARRRFTGPPEAILGAARGPKTTESPAA